MKDKLKLLISTFSTLLSYENQSTWSHWMNTVEKLLDENVEMAYDRYSQAYGGGGTLNDIHFSDPWSKTLFWKLRSVIGIYFHCLENNKEIETQLDEFKNAKLEELKVHCCSNCQSKFVTQRDLILTQIPHIVNTLILEDIYSTPMKTLWERFSQQRKESVKILEQVSETIDPEWSILRSDPWYQPCEKCGDKKLKIQSFKFDGEKWSMLS